MLGVALTLSSGHLLAGRVRPVEPMANLSAHNVPSEFS